MEQKPSYQELEQKIKELEERIEREKYNYVSDEIDLMYRNIVENVDYIINVFLPDTTELYVKSKRIKYILQIKSKK